MLALAPLLRGGNRYAALLILEWLALAVLATIGWRTIAREVTGTTRVAFSVLVFAPVIVALFQLAPIPAGWAAALPGRAQFYEIQQAFGAGGKAAHVSLMPAVTAAALLAGLPLIAAFVFGFAAGSRTKAAGFFVIACVALAEAVLALLQLGSPPDSLLWFGTPVQRPTGTFANPNHFANFMCTGVIALAVLLARREADPRRVGIVAASAGLLLLLVVLSRSRGAELLYAPFALIALAFTLRRAFPSSRSRWPAALSVGGLLVAAVALSGIDLAMSRLQSELVTDSAFGRWALAESSFKAAGTFWPLGSGLGTFEAVYARAQSPDVGGAVNHAHMDYAELLLELGWLFLVFFVAAGWLVIGQVRKMGAMDRQSSEFVARVVLACGLLGVALHGLVDFVLRIPATAMAAAFFFGCFVSTHRVVAGGRQRS